MRVLSRELVVNPNTVARAYTELEREGVLNTRQGLGVFVAEPQAELSAAARRERLSAALDRFLTEAVHLGFSADEVMSAVAKRIRGFQFVGAASTRTTDQPDTNSQHHYHDRRHCHRAAHETLRRPAGRRFAQPPRAAGQRLRPVGPQRRRQVDRHQDADGHGAARQRPGRRCWAKIRRRCPNATRARIAYLAEGHPLYGWMTIDDAVRFTRAFYPRWNDVLVDQILDHFELSRRQKFRRLSRGQQAQVSLALAVAPDPELLVLDDPTLGLDTVVRRDFLESLIQIIQRQGRTILFSSHILGDVERVADRIGIMVGGVLRVDCRTETFRESVRKLVLEFAGHPPESPAIPGLVSWRQVGNNLELVLVGYDDAQREAVEALGRCRSKCST